MTRNTEAVPSAEFPFSLGVSDLDWTLLGADFKISSANHEAVRRLVRAGLRFALASGRIYQQMTAYCDELAFPVAVISSNGAVVRAPGGEIIKEVGVPADLAADLIGWAHDYELTALLHNREGVCFTSRHHWNSDLQRHMEDTAVKVTFCTPADVRGQEPYKIVWSAPADRLDQMQAEAIGRFDGRVHLCRVDRETLEFMPLGVHKAFGGQAVAEHLGIHPSAVVAFGDGDNDCELLRWAGLGVAMYHGSEAARRAARLVASASNKETNFALAVEAVLAQTWR